MRGLRQLLFSISPAETGAERRGFPAREAEARPRLEHIGRTFVAGYRAGLDDPRPKNLAAALEQVPAESRGFAFEGAAMSLALLDHLTPWNRARLDALLAGEGARHVYLLHVGRGWAKARLKRRLDGPERGSDPLLGWLAVDGYGFHEGFFAWRRWFERRELPRRVSGYARRVFDQGLGRCAWFVFGARVERIARVLTGFAHERHSDLWSGVGLAAAYAGGVEEWELQALSELAGPHRPALAQGAAFAAQARARAGNPTDATERACRIFCGAGARDAARETERAEVGLPADGTEPRFEAWRRRIQKALA